MSFNIWDKVSFKYKPWSKYEKAYTVEGFVEETPKNPKIWKLEDHLWVRISLWDIDSTDRDETEDWKKETGLYPVHIDNLSLI